MAHLSAQLVGLIAVTIIVGLPSNVPGDLRHLLADLVVFGLLPPFAGYVAAAVVDRLRRRLVIAYLRASATSRQGRLAFRIEEESSTLLGRTLGWLAFVAAVLYIVSGGSRDAGTLLITVFALGVAVVAIAWLATGGRALGERRFVEFDASKEGLEWMGPKGERERLRWLDIRRFATRRSLLGETRTEVVTGAGDRHPYPTSYIEPESSEPVGLQTIVEALRPNLYRRRHHVEWLDAVTDLVPVGPGWS